MDGLLELSIRQSKHTVYYAEKRKKMRNKICYVMTFLKLHTCIRVILGNPNKIDVHKSICFVELKNFIRGHLWSNHVDKCLWKSDVIYSYTLAYSKHQRLFLTFSSTHEFIIHHVVRLNPCISICRDFYFVKIYK